MRRTFGDAAMGSRERSTRLLEEALELVQSEGVDQEFVDRLVIEVYSRPHGNLAQEAGGVALTLLAWCSSHGQSFEGILEAEVRRVLNKSPSVFRNRNTEKIRHGFSQQEPLCK